MGGWVGAIGSLSRGENTSHVLDPLSPGIAPTGWDSMRFSPRFLCVGANCRFGDARKRNVGNLKQPNPNLQVSSKEMTFSVCVCVFFGGGGFHRPSWRSWKAPRDIPLNGHGKSTSASLGVGTQSAEEPNANATAVSTRSPFQRMPPAHNCLFNHVDESPFAAKRTDRCNMRVGSLDWFLRVPLGWFKEKGRKQNRSKIYIYIYTCTRDRGEGGLERSFAEAIKLQPSTIGLI